MDEAGIGTDMLRHGGEEGDNVVLHHLLVLVDPLHVECRFLLDGGEGPRGDPAPLGVGLAGEDLHEEPGAVPTLGLPESGQFRPAVSRYHALLLSVSRRPPAVRVIQKSDSASGAITVMSHACCPAPSASPSRNAA